VGEKTHPVETEEKYSDYNQLEAKRRAPQLYELVRGADQKRKTTGRYLALRTYSKQAPNHGQEGGGESKRISRCLTVGGASTPHALSTDRSSRVKAKGFVCAVDSDQGREGRMPGWGRPAPWYKDSARRGMLGGELGRAERYMGEGRVE